MQWPKVIKNNAQYPPWNEANRMRRFVRALEQKDYKTFEYKAVIRSKLNRLWGGFAFEDVRLKSLF